MQCRSLWLLIRVNDWARDSPSEVAINWKTSLGRKTVSFLAGLVDGPGRPSKKNGIGTWRKVRYLLKLAGADPIGAFLVFLHLLERAERVGKFGLAEAEHEAAHAYAGCRRACRWD